MSSRLQLLRDFEIDNIWKLKQQEWAEEDRELEIKQVEHEEAFSRDLPVLIKSRKLIDEKSMSKVSETRNLERALLCRDVRYDCLSYRE